MGRQQTGNVIHLSAEVPGNLLSLNLLCEFLFTVCPCLGILAEISFLLFLSVLLVILLSCSVM